MTPRKASIKPSRLPIPSAAPTPAPVPEASAAPKARKSRAAPEIGSAHV